MAHGRTHQKAAGIHIRHLRLSQQLHVYRLQVIKYGRSSNIHVVHYIVSGCRIYIKYYNVHYAYCIWWINVTM